MKSRVLIYTPDADLRDAFTAWSREVDLDEVIIAQQPSEIKDAASNGDLYAVILDNSSGDIPLSSLTPELALSQPQARILVFPRENTSDDSELNTSGIFGYLSKPFSPEEMKTALQGSLMTASADVVNSAGSVLENPPTPPLDIPDANDDLGFLKGWILEADEEKNIDSAVVNDEKPEPEILDKPDEELASINAIELEDSGPTRSVEAEKQPTDAVATEVITDISRTETIIPGSQTRGRTHPPPLTEAETEYINLVVTSPVNLHSLRLRYSCVLIPRDPQHFLTRDLAERLGLMLPQLHLKRGWRVTGTAIRPQYMQWQAALPLDISPAEAVQEIRNDTSAWILANHPELIISGSEGDFWSPGYLVLSGELMVTPTMIHEYMQRARNAQDSKR